MIKTHDTYKKNENLPYSGLCRLGGPQSENQRKRKDWPRQRTKKDVEHEVDGGTSCNWCTWSGQQNLGKGTGRVGNDKINGDHPNYCIVVIGKNIEKSPGDLRLLAITHTLVKDPQLTLVGIIPKK